MRPVPSSSPIYGGLELSLEVDVRGSNYDPIHSQFYLVYTGSKVRHVTPATYTAAKDGSTLRGIVPGHNEPETVQLDAFIQISNKLKCIASCNFDYISDTIYQIAKMLTDGVDNENMWKKVEYLCKEYMDTTSVSKSEMDLCLTAAIKSLHLPVSWSYARNSIEDFTVPNDTLFHLVACLGFEKLALYLLTIPNNHFALQMVNHNGYLPEQVAYNKQFSELANLLRMHRKENSENCMFDRIEEENIYSPVVSCCLSWSNRDIDYDIAELERLMSNKRNRVEMSRILKPNNNQTEIEQKSQIPTILENFQSIKSYHCPKIIPAVGMTSHSPPKRKSIVLEDNLRRLHDIHEGIQRLRRLDTRDMLLQGWHKEGRSRLSSSCPSLPLVADNTGNGNNNNERFLREERINVSTATICDLPQRKRTFSSNSGANGCKVQEGKTMDNTVKIRVNDITPSNSQEFLNTDVNVDGDRKHSLGSLPADVQIKGRGSHIGGTSAQRCARKAGYKELVRRQSWSSLLSNTQNNAKEENLHIHKSWSLSSLESDTDDNTFYDARDLPLSPTHTCLPSSTNGVVSSSNDSLKEKQRSFSAGSGDDVFRSLVGDRGTMAVHSLTDINSDVHSCTEDETMGANNLIGCSDTNAWLSAPRTPLQKSVSTPSILIAQEIQEKNHRECNRDSLFSSQSFQLHEIDDDDDDANLVLEEDDEPDEMPNILSRHISLAGIFRDHSSLVQDSDEDKPFRKRRKRGSLFFRKKRGKDKEKETKKTPHQFVSICYSTAAVCDVCNKQLANKNALRCENCLVTVHESSCKDQILDCSKFKSPKLPPKNNSLSLSKDQLNTKLQVSHGRIPYYPCRYQHLLGSLNPTVTNLGNNKHHSSSLSSKEKKQGLISVNKFQSQPNAGNSNSPTLETSGKIVINSTSALRRPYTPSGYSQWRRVATKLGVNKVISEEKECEPIEDTCSSNITDVNSASMESLDEGAQEISDLDDDPQHIVMDEESESWSTTIDKKVLKKLKDKEIKRQEGIHELILTEKNHCITLKIMQKIYASGMIKELNMSKDLVERILPSIEELLDVHLNFLYKLKERQQKGCIIENVGDILVQQFQGEMAEQMKSAYGHFCSQHKDALSLYKDISKSDRKFQNFIKRYKLKPTFRGRSIPECILLVTQRITKYPLVIENLIKLTKDNKKEFEELTQALNLIKEIIHHVDAQVAEKDKEQRLLEIYNKVDAKSTAFYKGKKFRKSDLFSNNRKLVHEGPLSWRLSGKSNGKTSEVIGVLLSDVMLFLQENNQKYCFASIDNKSGILSLQKLLVRDKAGQDNRIVYLISSNPKEPEMYEIKFPTQKDKKVWIGKIKKAIEHCANEDEGIPSETEEQKLEEAKSSKLKELVGLLHDKDIEIAVVCEKKMKILVDILELSGIEAESYENVKYTHLVESEEGTNPKELMLAALSNASRLASSLYASGTNLSRSVSSAGEHQSETFISPQLPKRAETFGGFDNPNKEQNNNNKGLGVKKKIQLLKDQVGMNISSISLSAKSEIETELEVPDNKGTDAQSTPTIITAIPKSRTESPENQSPPQGSVASKEFLRLTTTPLLVTQGKEQLEEIVELSHNVNTLICLLSQHFSIVESMRVQLKEANEKIAKLTEEKAPREKRERRSFYRPEHQLEELRNLQEKLTQERLQWQKQRIEEEAELNKSKAELERLQEQIKSEQADLNHQRELLYRKLEALQKEGIILSPQHTVVNLGGAGNKEEAAAVDPVAQHRRSVSFDLQRVQTPAANGENRSRHDPRFQSSHSASSLPVAAKREGSRDPVPLQLRSATNMQKRQVGQVRQQLPLKLASGSSAANGPAPVPPPPSSGPEGTGPRASCRSPEEKIEGPPGSPKGGGRKSGGEGAGEEERGSASSRAAPGDRNRRDGDSDREIFC
ncbi:A-kinase anchor protein 13-like isoform X3 [Centruroides sculpturatus]|nr:A-kinase anchor protein 13-like isoform X3 [Centruroides sculpturatus]